MRHLWKQGLRRCWSCKEILDLSHFGEDKSQTMGKRYVCKPCHSVKTGVQSKKRMVVLKSSHKKQKYMKYLLAIILIQLIMALWGYHRVFPERTLERMYQNK